MNPEHAVTERCDECGSHWGEILYSNTAGKHLCYDCAGRNADATLPPENVVELPAETDLFPLLTADDLLELPDPAWLINGLVPASGLSVLYGASGTFKSFVAADWALSVASGLPWFGRDVEQRWVVYVAPEGWAGLGARYRAWSQAHGHPDVERIRFLPEAVNLRDKAQIERARRTFAALPEWPGLLVVDTMARTMPGGDENAAKDVGEFIAAIDVLRGDDAALVVHHCGKDGASERGSTALRGAAEMIAKVERDDRTARLELSCDKLKDGAEWNALPLQVEPSAGSLALSLRDEAAKARDDLREQVLAFVAEKGPVSQNGVEAGIRRRARDVRETLKALERDGLVRRRSAEGYEVRPASADASGTHRSWALGGAVRPEDDHTPVGGGPPGRTPAPRPATCVPDDTDAPEWAERIAEKFREGGSP